MKTDVHEHAARLAAYEKNAYDESFFLALNQALENADLPPDSEVVDSEKIPLIYVVGTPRSGTTLLSQLIARCLPVGYANNLTARFWLRPSAGLRLSNLFFNESMRANLGVKSVYGVTPNWFEPHEFGYFWRYWLLLDQSSTHRLSQGHLARIDQAGLRKTLQTEILAHSKKPFSIKNVVCGLNASFLTRMHPQSLFVNIDRDPFSSAASILNARKERYGDYGIWWSLKPSTYPQIAACTDPAEQVVQQVMDCRREFGEELALPGVRSVCISYQELVEDPGHSLNNIALSISDMGFPMDVIRENIPPLSASPHVSLPQEWEARLRDAIDKYLENK